MARVKCNVVGIALATALCATNAQAESDLLGTDDIAQAVVAMMAPVWTGPRTPAPVDMPRPADASTTIRSTTALLAVHAAPGTTPATIGRVMKALEYARSQLDVMGWPSPLPDADLGGGPGLDLYLTPTSLPTAAHSDGMAWWTYLDRASAFAVMDPETPDRAIDACVTAAYAEALLLSMDPAEARTWRRATAAWLTWVLTGHFGCEDAVWEQQANPYRSWVRDGAAEGAGGALLLAYLSARHDGRASQFVRDAWELSSQRTWEGDGLRAEPDLWAAIEASVERSGDRLLDNIEELAVLRWFVGRGETESSLIAAIDSDAQVPPMRRLERLPTRASAATALQPFGSAYVVLEGSTWTSSERLRAWMRGEYGVRWSFVAVQLDENGTELRRIAAPHTGPTPNAYVPIELDSRARQLLFVVTNLSSRLPDADEPDVNERSFELIVDRAE
jgi:hypothetical protein